MTAFFFFRFPGQYYDTESGLHYNWHRYYDPETGRYISADPIGFEGGDVNLYVYVWSNPVNWMDPEGLKAYTCVSYWPQVQAQCEESCARDGLEVGYCTL